MHKVLWFLATLITAALVLGACAPAASGTTVPDEWSARVNGVPIRYVVKDSVTLQGVPIDAWSEWVDGECRIDIQTDYARTMDANRLAGLTAGCFLIRAREALGVEHFDTAEGEFAFGDRYAALFARECGNSLGALGWRNTDTECSNLPPFEEAL